MNPYPHLLEEPVYRKDDYEQMAVRTDPSEKRIFKKFKGSAEVEVADGETLYIEVLRTGQEISKEEYEAY